VSAGTSPEAPIDSRIFERGEREGSKESSGGQKLYQFKPLKQIIFILIVCFFILWEEFIVVVFLNFKVCEKTNMSSGWFFISGDFGFLIFLGYR